MAGVRRRLFREPAEAPAEPTQALPVYDSVATYQTNISMAATLGSVKGVTALFFWQPSPPSNLPMRQLAERVRQSVRDDNFHFIADLFNNEDPADLYVDRLHYGDTAGERVAEVIAGEILSRLRKSASHAVSLATTELSLRTPLANHAGRCSRATKDEWR
jgi:hypothetical protein